MSVTAFDIAMDVARQLSTDMIIGEQEITDTANSIVNVIEAKLTEVHDAAYQEGREDGQAEMRVYSTG